MKTYTIRRGYVSVAQPRRSKYPFAQIKEGEGIAEPFPLADLKKVRFSMEYWNRKHGGLLRINRFPDGTEEHPEPHFTVGWPQGEKPRKPRKKRKAKTGPV